MIKFLISATLAFAIQNALDWILPQDLSRVTVIMLGGLTAFAWSWLDNLIQGVK